MVAVNEDLDVVDDGYRVALSDIPPPGPWARMARCRKAPISIFFPTRGDPIKPAKAICAGCPVLAECRDYGLTWPVVGIWGGLAEQERKRMRKAVTPEPPPYGEPRKIAARGSIESNLRHLTGRPGDWARVARFPAPTSGASLASLYRTGRRQTPLGRWEFEGRRNEEGGSDLFACFLGPDPELLDAGFVREVPA